MKFEDIDTAVAVIKIRGNDGHGRITRALQLSDRTSRVLATYKTTLKRSRGPLVGNLLNPERGVTAMRIGVIAHKALESLGVKRAGDDQDAATRHDTTIIDIRSTPIIQNA